MEQRQIIYTITSLFIKNVIDEKRLMVGQAITNRSRMVGFYSTLEKARKAVEEDWAGFDEAGYYNYIVIERMVEGLYNLSGLSLNDETPGEHWYHHDYNMRKWIPCEKPKCLIGTIGFGLG